jgi:hypothetical protein
MAASQSFGKRFPGTVRSKSLTTFIKKKPLPSRGSAGGGHPTASSRHTYGALAGGAHAQVVLDAFPAEAVVAGRYHRIRTRAPSPPERERETMTTDPTIMLQCNAKQGQKDGSLTFNYRRPFMSSTFLAYTILRLQKKLYPLSRPLPHPTPPHHSQRGRSQI